MKNQKSLLLFGGIILFAIIGIFSMLLANPAGFFQRIAFIALVGFAIYFVVRLISNSNPKKKEQRAFLKAAKQSKRRLQQKSVDHHVRNASQGPLATIKRTAIKRETSHLTVIDGKKGKKKNRASF